MKQVEIYAEVRRYIYERKKQKCTQKRHRHSIIESNIVDKTFTRFLLRFRILNFQLRLMQPIGHHHR